MNISIKAIWYIKQNNHKDFIIDFYNNKKNEKWIEENVLKMQEELKIRDKIIDDIRIASTHIKWKEIEMDFEQELNKDCIIQKVLNS